MVVGALGSTASPAQAAITYVGEKCASASWNGPAGFASLSINTSGTNAAVGDVMILAVNTTDGQTIGAVAGWTALQSTGGFASFYRVATSADVSGASYSLLSSDNVLGGAAVATITAYRGASTSMAPIIGTPLQTGSGSSVTLPNATALAAGSMRVSLVSIANADAGFSRPTYNVTVSTMTNRTDCTAKNSYAWPVYAAAGMQQAYEVVGSGVTATRTATISASAPYVGATYILTDAGASLCAGGALTLSAQPETMTFPAVTLDGRDQTRTGVGAFTVDDQRTTPAGWSLSATSTTFVNGVGDTLPTTATTVTGGSAAAAAGNCSLPTNSVSYPVQIPAGSTAPAAVKIFNAATGTGSGPSTITPTFELAIPANARIGAYSSTWTFTVSSGP